MSEPRTEPPQRVSPTALGASGPLASTAPEAAETTTTPDAVDTDEKLAAQLARQSLKRDEDGDNGQFDIRAMPLFEPEHEDNEVHFILSAEFDIDQGATLTHQYPFPTGAREQRIAELMLPDGTHSRSEDWTVFYMGQNDSSSIDPILESQSSAPGSSARPRSSVIDTTAEDGAAETKRGGGLLYVISCVRTKADSTVRRGATVRALAVCSPNPHIQIYKPMMMLALDETFTDQSPEVLQRLYDSFNSIPKAGMPSFTRMEKILLRQTERKDLFAERFPIDRSDGEAGSRETFEETEEGSSVSSHQQQQRPPQQQTLRSSISSRASRPAAGRKLSDSSSLIQRTPSIREGVFAPDVPAQSQPKRRRTIQRDTHYFDTEVTYGSATAPMRIPTALFADDVGDYSLIELVSAFQNATPLPSPYIPYIHTNGAQTHPLIVILNAIITHKRVLFISQKQGSNLTARMILAACAMASGSGQVLRGLTAHAYPTAGLWDMDTFESSVAYIAGVTNPQLVVLTRAYDVVADIDEGKVTISPHFREGPPPPPVKSSGLSSDTSDDYEPPSASTITPEMEKPSPSRADCVDNAFVEDIVQAVQLKYGESLIRLRFIDYMTRFVSLVAAYESERFGSTKIGYPTMEYKEGRLGSGAVFADEAAKTREMASNHKRIEAWRASEGYEIAARDWQRTYRNRPIQFDIAHQISKLRMAKNLSDSETEAIFEAIARGAKTYEQIIELLTHLPQHLGGLAPLGHGLLHRWPGVSEHAVDIFLNLQEWPVGRQAVAGMNYFHRKTFLHLLEQRAAAEAHHAQLQAGEHTVNVEQYSPDIGSRGYQHTPDGVNGGGPQWQPAR